MLRLSGRRSAATTVALTMPLAVGGCACFSPILKAVDAALTPGPAWVEPAPKPTRVKAYSRHGSPGDLRRKAPKASSRLADTGGEYRLPRHAISKQFAQPTAQPAQDDDADPQAIAKAAERLAAADAAIKVESDKAVSDARTMMQRGEVQAARRRLLAAMTGNNAEVVLTFARTFDPAELARLPRSDAAADPVRARALYEHAARMGAKEAAEPLKRLPPPPPPAAAAAPSPMPPQPPVTGPKKPPGPLKQGL